MRFLRKRKTSLPSWTRKKSFLAFFSLIGFTLGSYFGFYFYRFELLALFLILLISFLLFGWRKGKSAFLAFIVSLSLSFVLERIPLPDEKEEVGATSGIVIETKTNYFLFQSGIRTYYVYEKETEREIGDVLEIRGKKSELKETTYEGRFSFKEYLSTRGIRYEIKAYTILAKSTMPLRLRKKEKEFLSVFPSTTSSLIDSLLFDKRSFHDETIENASSLGVLYLFSNSGVYLSMALHLVEKMLRRFCSQKASRGVSLGFLFLLLPFSFTKIGYCRVLISRVLSFLFVNDKWKLDSLGKASLTGMALILFSFRVPLRSAFLVGEGLMIQNTFLNSYFAQKKKKQRKRMSFLSFRLFLLPMSLISGQYHVFSLFYAITLPLFLFPFLLLSSFSFISVPFSALNQYASFLSSLLSFLVRMDISVPLYGDFNAYMILLYYVTYFGFFFFSRAGFTLLKKIAPIAYSCLFLLQSLPLQNSLDGEVTFINVGQGDAILIRERNHSFLIDTGGVLSFDLGREVDVPYLRKKRIYSLDAIIVTHSDYDHSGALASIRSSFSVKQVIESQVSFPLTIGNMTIHNLNIYGGESENEKSLVLYMEYLGKKWLFMGDAPKSIEKKIIDRNPNLRCDVLKVGHHGSDTSSSLSFLKTVQPKEAIISVGANNRYRHPSDGVLNRFASLDIVIRRTDIEGTITYKSWLS